jgi:hypothetical protein
MGVWEKCAASMRRLQSNNRFEQTAPRFDYKGRSSCRRFRFGKEHDRRIVALLVGQLARQNPHRVGRAHGGIRRTHGQPSTAEY